MKTVSSKQLFVALVLFVFFSMIIFLFDIPPFIFPHIPMFVIFVSLEKNIRKKMIVLSLALLLYSQFATPFPVLFLMLISLQIYIAAQSVLSVSVFDYSLSALISSIFIQIILNFNSMAYIYAFTSDLKLYSAVIYISFSSGLVLFCYTFFKQYFDKIFIKDTWL
jgi:hypothetical protein